MLEINEMSALILQEVDEDSNQISIRPEVELKTLNQRGCCQDIVLMYTNTVF